jgi:GNAT superfamily N-acetyltransferase
MSMVTGRELARDGILGLWSIDRAEVIDSIYYYENGELVLKPEHYDMHGFPPGEPETFTPHLLACYERGGWFYGLFDGDRLVAEAVLDRQWLGPRRDLLQLKALFVSRQYRDQGLGRRLFELAAEKARSLGAKGLYISATPSEHTINFYTRLGCAPTATPDPELFALEPEDIHLEYRFDQPVQDATSAAGAT